MANFELTTMIRASPARCFDLSRDLDMHQRCMQQTEEEIVGGRRGGLIEMGEEVTWRAKHFGLFHLHTARITAFERPLHFRDEMIRGRFRSFVHDHYFVQTEGGTLMRDAIEFSSPLGWLGRLVDALVLKRYLRRLIEQRNELILSEAEAHGD